MDSAQEGGPWVVLVTGPPGSGKTTLARPMASALGLPLLSKDDLKEILFDRLGWGGTERSRQVSDAAYDLMLHVTRSEVQCGRSLVLEANFRPEIAAALSEVGARGRVQFLQVYCSASAEQITQRLQHRLHHAPRHPGHADSANAGLIPDWLRSARALALPGPVLQVDTTDPRSADPARVAAEVGCWRGGTCRKRCNWRGAGSQYIGPRGAGA